MPPNTNDNDYSKKPNMEIEAFEQKLQAIFRPKPKLSVNTSNLQAPTFSAPQPSLSQRNIQPTMAPVDQSPHHSLDSTPSHAPSLFSNNNSNSATPSLAEKDPGSGSGSGSLSPNIISASPSLFTSAQPSLHTTNPQLSPFPPSFPFHRPPQKIPIRLADQKSALKALDTEYDKKEHPLEENERIRGMGVVKDEKGKVQEAMVMGWEFEEAARKLRDHYWERVPYMQLASTRLQAVLGERNELAFDLPKPMKPTVSPQFQAVFGAERFVGPKFGAGLGTGTRDNVGLGLDIDPLGLAKLRKTRGLDVGSNVETGNSNPLGPPISSPFTPFDPKSGEGLKDWLMKIGKENGTLKRKSCKSISFHDFTADMKTGAFSNVLVLHYNDEGPDQTIEVYEVSLPTSYFNEKTSREAITYQKWIWFFIARPVITFAKDNKPTKSSHSLDSTLSSPEDIFYTPLSNMRSTIDPEERGPKPPPNFPEPIPIAWMIFASPTDHLTTYPTQVENVVLDPSNTTSRHCDENKPPSLTLRIPAKRSNPFTQPSSSQPQPKRMIHKRTDYDFSHQGLSLFEFSNAHSTHFPLTPSFSKNDPTTFKTGNWLSVPAMPAFISPFLPPYPPFVSGLQRSKFDFELKHEDEFELEKEDWMKRLKKEERKLTKEERAKDERECRERGEEFPCPFLGKWWEGFYKGVAGEEGRWRRVRRAMGKGKCRVVVRWVEEGEEEEGEEREVKRGRK